MTTIPAHIWLDWREANKVHLAYDEPPARADEICQDHYVSFAAFDAVVVSLAEAEALEQQHGEVIARLSAELSATLAANQKLVAENARLGRELNLAKYGEPDFAWSVHMDKMADLEDALTEATAELIYLRKYGKDGAVWSANDSKDVWRAAARAFLAGEGK